MDRLTSMEMFVRVVDLGGFKPAAVVKGNIHADRVVVQSLKLTK